MKPYHSTAILLPVCLFVVFAIANPVYGQVADYRLEELCEKLEDLRILDAFILSASIVPVEGDIPEHCLVVGYTLPSNHFEIRLPTKDWNGKFFLAGCGGACGRLPVNISGYSKTAIQRGYAISTMDTGHWGSSLFDFRWGYNNPVAEVDYAHKAVHETTRVSKIVIREFSGQDPTHSYFGGCSNGGRQGLMEALRYPEDFDGIISEAPGISMTDVTLLFLWMDKQNTGSDGKDIIGPADIPIIAKAVYEACDATDGQKDGLISDPRKCRFDPSSLLCTREDQTDCLNAEQVRVLRSWYEGPVNSAGEPILSSGVALSSEPFWWWFVGQTDRAHDHIFSAPDALRYVYLEEDPGPNYDPYTDFDFSTDPPKLGYIGKLLNADSPQLDKFKESGGKLLMFQGWSDPAIPYETTIGYYNKVESRFGGKEDTQDFFRLFMIPGMDHCSINQSLGIRAESLDPLTALEKWVENNEAPDELPVTRFDDNGGVLSQFSVYPFSGNE